MAFIRIVCQGLILMIPVHIICWQLASAKHAAPSAENTASVGGVGGEGQRTSVMRSRSLATAEINTGEHQIISVTSVGEANVENRAHASALMRYAKRTRKHTKGNNQIMSVAATGDASVDKGAHAGAFIRNRARVRATDAGAEPAKTEHSVGSLMQRDKQSKEVQKREQAEEEHRRTGTGQSDDFWWRRRRRSVTTCSRRNRRTTAKLTIITHNQGLTDHSDVHLANYLEKADSNVAAICRQESQKRFPTPEGWVKVFEKRQVGMTKWFKFKLANIYLTVLRRSSSNVSVGIRRCGRERVSISGKGSVYAELNVGCGRSPARVVVMCTHIPTDPAERESGVQAVLEDVSEELKPNTQCDEDLEFPKAHCWDVLAGVILTGDLNFRLDGKVRPSMRAASREWLLTALQEQRWAELQKMDTIFGSALMAADVGFQCANATYLPTYKLNNALACLNGDVEKCYLPGAEIPKKGDELQVGWLDRSCWHTAKPQTFRFLTEQALPALTHGSDHVPVETIFELNNLPAS